MKYFQINEVVDPALSAAINDFKQRGGVINFGIYHIESYEWIEGNEIRVQTKVYDAHLVVARSILCRIHYERNLKNCGLFFKPALKDYFTDYDILDKSGQKINLEEFMGFRYYMNENKFYIGDGYNFYFDTESVSERNTNIDYHSNEYFEKYPESQSGFNMAFLDPPYSANFGKTLLEEGKYFKKFIAILFNDLSDLVIYKWSTKASGIFNPGEEWWGTYYWTVYNPTKNWYIGMIAAETD